jgi:hypothetical protein
MVFVVRDFNTPKNDIGDITVYLSNNNKICVNILNLHGLGQAWMYIKYYSNLDVYETFLSILNKLTRDIFRDCLDVTPELSKIPNYKDIVCVEDTVVNSRYSNHWGNYVDFTRESVNLLLEHESDRDEAVNYPGVYIIKGEILENGEFIYDKPIRSNSYKG